MTTIGPATTTPPYRHLLITKFNILASAGYGDPSRRLDESWIDSRLREFETFCIPTVAAQRDAAEFSWLVLCDRDSPDRLRTAMSTYGSMLTPLYLSGVRNATLGAYLVASGFVDRPWLITTRLDSDDGISRHFMRNVQAQFAQQRRMYVEFRHGLRAFQGGLYSAVWRSNPFLSLIEEVQPGTPPAVVYELNHRRVVGSGAPVTVVWTGRHWLRSMHDSNVVQTPLGFPLLRERHPDFAVRPSERIRSAWPIRLGQSIAAYGRVHLMPRARRVVGLR